MKATYALTIAAIKITFRNRSHLVFTFLLPMVILLIMSLVPSGGSARIRVGVVTGKLNAAGAQVVAGLRKNDALTLQQGTLQQMQAELNSGKLALLVELPDDLALGGKPVRLYSSSSEASAVETVKGLLISQAQKVLAPAANLATVPLDEHRVDIRRESYVSFLLPGLIGLGIMQMCIFSVAPVFVFYRERGILKRLLSTPMKPYQFIVSSSVARVLLAFAQTTAFLIAGSWILDRVPEVSYLALVLCIALGSIMFLGVGFGIAGLASSMETASVLANLITFPMMFLGGTFFSVNSLPNWLRDLVSYLPLTHFCSALRAILTEHADFGMVGGHMIGLLIWSLAFIIFALMTFRLRTAQAG